MSPTGKMNHPALKYWYITIRGRDRDPRPDHASYVIDLLIC
jgi:hypothetical protein